ncbi:MAG: YIP1 family protein [Oligoflexia bacterium]|nr:YIP1 family protein [Oligoflexia bacterium]
MTQIPSPPGFKLNWNEVKLRLKEVFLFMPQYLKNPHEGIKRAPHWDWWTIIILEISLGILTGILSGLVSRHILAILGGIIIAPIMNLIVSATITGIMYYICLFLLKTEIEFKKLFTVVVLAKIPSQLLSVVSPIAKPIALICIVMAAFLLVVGLVENFMLDKKKVTKIVGTLAGILILFWLYSVIIDATGTKIKVQEYTPESLDQISKEIGEATEGSR